MDCNQAPDYLDVFFYIIDSEGATAPQSFLIPNWGYNLMARDGRIKSESESSNPNYAYSGSVPSYRILNPFSGRAMIGSSILKQDGLAIDFINNISNALVNKSLVIDQIELYLSMTAFPLLGADGALSPPTAPINYSVITSNMLGDLDTKGGALHLNTAGRVDYSNTTGTLTSCNYIAKTNFIYGAGSTILIAPGNGGLLGQEGMFINVRLRVARVMSAIETLLYNAPGAAAQIADHYQKIGAEKPVIVNNELLRIDQ